jgi:hypothetical protein
VRRQRTFFLGKRPSATVRKDGENPLVPERRHSRLLPADLSVRFDNETVTQVGGYPALSQFLGSVGLNGLLAQHVKMARGPLAFTAPELSRFLVDAKLLGADRLMHVETLRLDPLLTTMSGIDGLPSGKTLGVYLKSFDAGHLSALDALNVKVLHQQWKRRFRGQKKPDVILDFDSTTMTTYGQQEGSDRGRCFRKKDKPGYQPKFAFIGGLGLMLHQRLEPQSQNLNSDFESFFVEAERRLPRKARFWAVRGDGALYSHERILALERRGLVYAISAARTEDLRAVIREIDEEGWEEGVDESGRPYSIARVQYCPKTWGDRRRTYVVSRRLKDDHFQARLFAGEQYKYFAYVTNFRGPLLSQFLFGVERCSLESFIKESKAGFDYHRLPCAERNANEAYLRHVQLAYNLAIFFKLALAPRGVNRWTIDTLRTRLFRVCGNLVRKAGRFTLSLPSWWPYRSVLSQIFRHCTVQMQT